jgi:hypothetical protein
VWPGINGLNVWDLDYQMWLLYSRAAEQQEINEKKEQG